MSGKIAARLAELGIELPAGNTPRGKYVPYVITGNLVFIAGQGPRRNGEMIYAGKVGKDLDIAGGQAAAALCTVNLLSHLATACGGNLDRVRRAVRIAGLVNCGPDFTEHAKVMDGASSLLHEVFGEVGSHARIASGAMSLPSNMAVEVEGVFEID
ncbi:RidA family protein [Azoarcus sp. TTM-91]|uniref:RidA family protein n=1 Tax=Azoarcus sp. TTM-91 TaxID=2691581 RepID=UPI00145EF6EE|nr:RidA family protein [Azoarcus sp. TTM-91]NMG36692.1 RidA family protein [Azoarcus sp. TTM-91]